MTSIIKFISLVTLILLDFIYLLPTYMFGLVINFIIMLIWYFPSIYQLYLFISTAKGYDLRIRIYLLFFSPIIIVLYILFFVIYYIGYSVFISLINPLITIIQRPEYPLYSISSTAAIACLFYKYKFGYSIKEFLLGTIFSEKIDEITHFVKECWNFNSLNFQEKIKQSKSHIFESIFYTIINILDLFIITTIFIIIIMINMPYAFIIALFKLLIIIYDEIFTNCKYAKFCYFIYFIYFILRFLWFFTRICLFIYPRTIYTLYRKIIELHKRKNGFYIVINLLWVISICPFLNSDGFCNKFIYIICRINILRYNQRYVTYVTL
jgi:hypothetical protein